MHDHALLIHRLWQMSVNFSLQFGPVIPESSAQYVHHAVVYLCSDLNNTHVGASTECDDVHIDIRLCRSGGTIIAAWAVGGEVSLQSTCNCKVACMCLNILQFIIYSNSVCMWYSACACVYKHLLPGITAHATITGQYSKQLLLQCSCTCTHRSYSDIHGIHGTYPTSHACSSSVLIVLLLTCLLSCIAIN